MEKDLKEMSSNSRKWKFFISEINDLNINIKSTRK